MPRVKRGTKRRDSRRKTLTLAKGFFLTKSKLYRSAQEAVEKSLRYGYKGRRLKKRDFRSLWIVRIGAACKAACEADNKCRAWTYVRAGYIGPTARCYLKDNITRPRHKPCCISGVVR